MIGIFGSINGESSITQVTMSVWLTVKERVLLAVPDGGELDSSKGERVCGSRRAASALADPLMNIQLVVVSSLTFPEDVF